MPSAQLIQNNAMRYLESVCDFESVVTFWHDPISGDVVNTKMRNGRALPEATVRAHAIRDEGRYRYIVENLEPRYRAALHEIEQRGEGDIPVPWAKDASYSLRCTAESWHHDVKALKWLLGEKSRKHAPLLIAATTEESMLKFDVFYVGRTAGAYLMRWGEEAQIITVTAPTAVDVQTGQLTLHLAPNFTDPVTEALKRWNNLAERRPS